MEDYYEILGIPKSATAEHVRTAWRAKALANHPDKNGGTVASKERFQKIQAAYECLSNPPRRAQYDSIYKPPTASMHKPTPKNTARYAAPEGTPREEAEFYERWHQHDLQTASIQTKRGTIYILEGWISSHQKCVTRLEEQINMWDPIRRERVLMLWMETTLMGRTIPKNGDNSQDEMDLKMLARITRLRANIEEFRQDVRKADDLIDEWEREEVIRAKEKEELEAKKGRKAEEEQKAREAEESAKQRAGEEAEKRRKAAAEQKEKEEAEARKREEQIKAEQAKLYAQKQAQQAQEDSRRKFDEQRASNRPSWRPLRAHQPTHTTKSNPPLTAPKQPATTCAHRMFWNKIPTAWERCTCCCRPLKSFILECPGCRKRACADCKNNIKGVRAKK
ncbi:hypothetical protein TWF281_004898 [Arthrobotrys megalospora]